MESINKLNSPMRAEHGNYNTPWTNDSDLKLEKDGVMKMGFGTKVLIIY